MIDRPAPTMLLTVKQALVGSTVVEYYREPDWWQVMVAIGDRGGARVFARWRHKRAASWSDWGQPWEPAIALACPCRVIAGEVADADPASRGPL